jgi:hypothetical protein|nr:MAG TPA: hypothetical protein [Caudoviricetes sp.]
MIEVKGNQLRMEGSEDEVESQVAAVLAGYTRFLYKNYPPCVAKEKLDKVIKLGSFTDEELDEEIKKTKEKLDQLLHELFSFNEEDK